MPWKTERAGHPIQHVEGWGIDGIDDFVALQAYMVRVRPYPLEWTLNMLAPKKPAEKPIGFWDPIRDRDGLTAHARKMVAAREERQKQFLTEMHMGCTVRQACEKVGIKVQTYTQWRTKFPEFKNKVDRIRAGITEDDSIDETFIGRRRYYFGYETYAHHQKIVEAIEDTPEGGITMIILPPEAGKTQLVQDWVSDKIALNPDLRITYVSESAEQQSPAMKVLSAIKDRMTDPNFDDPDTQHRPHIPEWINRFGPFRDDAIDKNKPWNQKYIKVHKAGARRDYTFQAVSWRSKIYGSRCDWMIFDDVQSDESINLTDKMMSRFRKTFFNRPGKKGHIVFIGTRVGVGDVYEKLAEEIPERMIRIVQIPALDEEGNSYCPEMWPEDALQDKRDIVGEEGWTTAYMMRPQDSGANTFSEEMLDAARDRERVYGIREPGIASLTLAGLDPALGGGNAIVAAQTTNSQFRVLAAQVDYGLARNEDIFAKLRSFCRYRFDELVVERNSQQRGIARDERLKEMSHAFGFRITEHETGKNKWDFIFGVGAMAGSFIKGEITFPDATPDCRRRMEALRSELLAWRPNVDPKLLRQDLVMALWFPWLIWMNRRKQMKQPKAWDIGGTPWRPGDMSGRWGGSSRQRGMTAVR